MLTKLSTDRITGQHAHFAEDHGVTFIADDLDELIALHRRINAKETSLARIIEESAEEVEADYGRLPAGSQGPHSPTD